MTCEICKKELMNIPIYCYSDKQYCGKVCVLDRICQDDNIELYEIIGQNNYPIEKMRHYISKLQNRRVLDEK